MEIYQTKDKKVTKYIHDDGSETAIKHSFEQPTEKHGEFSKITNKFNVFISSSVGCNIKCSFCYLTLKNVPFFRLTKEEITKNIIDAITHQINTFPHLKDQYVKLSWMGMGDAGVNFQKTIEATEMIISEILKKQLCKGIDNIDISTMMPTSFKKGSLKDYVHKLNALLDGVPINPLRKLDPKIRIFYSLHSGLDSVRRTMIPQSKDINSALNELKTISSDKAKIIIHHMFLDKVNDSPRDIQNLIKIMTDPEMKNYQLRILRYNKCDHSIHEESQQFVDIINRLHDHDINMKVQISPGSSVKAACGQFLLKQFERND